MSNPILSRGKVKLLLNPLASYDSREFEVFKIALLNAGAQIVDDHAQSITDYLTEKDEDGSDERPFTVASVAETRKARFLYNKRKKVAYGLIIQHVSEPSLLEYISGKFRQDGLAAWKYLIDTCEKKMNRAELRKLEAEWAGLNILADVGISANSLKMFANHISQLAYRFPITDAKDETERAEKFLECLFESSNLFYESAHREYNAEEEDWLFK